MATTGATGRGLDTRGHGVGRVARRLTTETKQAFKTALMRIAPIRPSIAQNSVAVINGGDNGTSNLPGGDNGTSNLPGGDNGTSNLPGGDGFSVVPLEADEHTATVDVQDSMVQLGVLGPVAVTKLTFTKREARGVALAIVEASEQIGEED